MAARIKLLGVRFSVGEFVRIATAAESLEMTPTAWVRHQVLRSLESQPEPAAWAPPPAVTGPAVKLTRTAGTRFTEMQMEALRAHSRACGLTPTAFIRKLVLGVKPIARIPATRLALAALNRVGNNLNQLVKLANSGVIMAPDLIGVLHQVFAEFLAMQKVFFDLDR